jgi:hypothetical protein
MTKLDKLTPATLNTFVGLMPFSQQSRNHNLITQHRLFCITGILQGSSANEWQVILEVMNKVTRISLPFLMIAHSSYCKKTYK